MELLGFDTAPEWRVRSCRRNLWNRKVSISHAGEENATILHSLHSPKLLTLTRRGTPSGNFGHELNCVRTCKPW